VAFPTETVYGVGARADNADALARLRELKDRPARPFSVHLGSVQDVGRYVASIPRDARRLMDRAWPGPVTLLLNAGGALAEESLQAAGLYEVLCHDDVIALRLVDLEPMRRMLADAGGPVVATSANHAGRPSALRGDDVRASLDGQIDLLIDAGPTRCGGDSTIVRVGDGGWKILRKGVVSSGQIRNWLRRRYVFVCTGNTCRSPIAAGLARQEIAQSLGCTVRGLRRKGVDIQSAGLVTFGGSPVAPEAALAAAEHGVDLSNHRSQRLTDELICSADMIFCMAESHVAEILRRVPQAKSKVQRLNPDQDIPDPIGGGQAVYRETANRIADALARRMEKGLP
jgi:tRNA threonylcarbamoyl adenosine modification protein (Sua5/YciO/YrdC/YwlC family)